MVHPLSPIEEIRQLVDQLVDGQLNAAGYARIEALILQDQRCLQKYVERLDFHSELVEQAENKSPETAVLDGLRKFEIAAKARDRRRNRLTKLSLAACTLALTIALAWLYHTSSLWIAAPMGRIASLSVDLRTQRTPLELGQVIRQNETISITAGIASIQLPDVMLDLIAPASIRFERRGHVYLTTGKVIANVQQPAIGFTVRTPDTEVVDLGTEFLVQHQPQAGTEVSVRRGRAQASLLDWRNQSVKVLELTANRSAHLHRHGEIAREVDFEPAAFDSMDETRGGIRSIDGNLRTSTLRYRSFRADRITTPNHLLVIPEQQNIQLDADLVLNGLQGPTRIPAGSIVSSYLVHFDPTDLGKLAPRGAISFFGTIAAVVGSAEDLAATDRRFGLKDTFYETESFRELELDEDEIQISDDRKTLSFYFGTSPPHYLDEARIFVVSQSP